MTERSDIQKNLSAAIRYAEYTLVNASKLGDTNTMNRMVRVIADMQAIEQTVK